jgi:hypothetical protein
MNQNLPTILTDNSESDLPLPLLVAQKWNFPLTHVEAQPKWMYSVQDWIVGLTDANNARRIWSDLKRNTEEIQLYDSIVQLPRTASDGKDYLMDFTDDKGLYLVAQHLRVTKSRPLLASIKKYLAEAGAFVDLMRRKPETVVTSGAIDPDQAVDAVIEYYRSRGKNDRWIAARLDGKIKRAKFTAALSAAVCDVLSQWHYATATDEIYLGLWKRTSAHLKRELGLKRKDSLRDNQPTLALAYQGIAEEVAGQRLGDRNELTWGEARQIIQEVAALIGVQGQATSHFLKTDLATGRSLLTP